MAEELKLEKQKVTRRIEAHPQVKQDEIKVEAHPEQVKAEVAQVKAEKVKLNAHPEVKEEMNQDKYDYVPVKELSVESKRVVRKLQLQECREWRYGLAKIHYQGDTCIKEVVKSVMFSDEISHVPDPVTAGLKEQVLREVCMMRTSSVFGL